MTICLITPPSCFLLDERVFLSLGILKIAAVLEQYGHTVEVVDLSGIAGFEAAAADHAAATEAKVFGITATTPQMPAVRKIVEAVRSVRADARIILGGPHVTLVAAALKREKKIGLAGRATRAWATLEAMFDVLVTGDGEDAIFVALDPGCEKWVDADKPSSRLFLSDDKLNQLPWPARHLVDVSSYHYSIEGHKALSLIAQLGCPFACGFCGGRESPMLRRIRTRTTENIVREVVHLHTTYGVTGIMFYDDEMNLGKSMVELMNALSDAQDKLGTEFRMRGFIKSQLFTDEQAASMYRAGFRWILVGFESGSERILENINKKATRDENTRCMEIAKRHNLKVKALMSMGHPGESEQTVQDSKDWLLEVQPDDFDMTVITTYPGTPYFDWAVQTAPDVWTYTYPKNGDKLHAYDVEFTEEAGYYKGRPGEYSSFVFTDYLAAVDLVRLRDNLEADVRARLSIPFNQSAVAMKYEHAMGQGLPGYILKTNANRILV